MYINHPVYTRRIKMKRILALFIALIMMIPTTAVSAKADSTTDFFYEKADSEFIEKYMSEIDARIEEIKNTPTEVEVTGTKYYVSSTGSDLNDGLSPETAWKTVTKVNSEKFAEGDGVFFKRGDSWRITAPLSCQSGVTYSAYGDGAKPKFIASINGDGADKWLETEYENVYKFYKDIPASNDVGTIVFDGGRAWGVMTQVKSDGTRIINYTDSFNYLFNGIERYKINADPFNPPKDLSHDLEFYHDWDTNTLYLCSKDGNPGERFSSIEIVDKGHAVVLSWNNIVVDNLEIFGTGSHGISSGGANNVTVQNCVLSWIGGSIQSKSGQNELIRFGNAVEVYGSATDFTIRNNYATQVYDCCWTVQNGSATTFKNVSMYDNVSEFCNSGLEVWEGGGKIENMQLYNNYTRFNGYGWSHQRNNGGGTTFYGAGNNSGTYSGNDVYNNVSLFTSENVLFVAATGVEQYNFHDNIYVMENNKKMAFAPVNPGEGKGDRKWHNYNEKDLKAAYETGFEKGSKFYYTEPSPFEDMYDMAKVINGVYAFEDISDDFWGRDAIDHVTLRGLFNGVTKTEFAPDNTMTRGMLATVLYRLSGDTGYSKQSYSDVDKNAWFAPAAAWAEANGIVSETDKFRPDDSATREEMADMLFRFAKYLYKYSEGQAGSDFFDSASIDEKYRDGVIFCTSNGIISGYDDGTVKPKNNATRAEVATMIMRFNSYLSSAPVNYEQAKLDAIYTSAVLNGDTLNKMIDRNHLKANVNENGSIRFTTFTESGSPEICIYNIKNTEVLFSDYNCAVIKFNTNLDISKLSATFGYLSFGGWESFSPSTLIPTIDAEKGFIYFDYTEEIKAIGNNSKNTSIGFHIYPWGVGESALGANDYFEIESITLYKSSYGAEANLYE